MVVQKEWFVCDNDDIDCVIQEGGQTSFEGPLSGNYTLCTSEQDNCPFANDAGFDIEITVIQANTKCISCLDKYQSRCFHWNRTI